MAFGWSYSVGYFIPKLAQLLILYVSYSPSCALIIPALGSFSRAGMIKAQEGQTVGVVNILVVRLYYSFVSLTIEGNWVKYTQDLSVLYLITAYVSTIISK